MTLPPAANRQTGITTLTDTVLSWQTSLIGSRTFTATSLGTSGRGTGYLVAVFPHLKNVWEACTHRIFDVIKHCFKSGFLKFLGARDPLQGRNISEKPHRHSFVQWLLLLLQTIKVPGLNTRDDFAVGAEDSLSIREYHPCCITHLILFLWNTNVKYVIVYLHFHSLSSFIDSCFFSRNEVKSLKWLCLLQKWVRLMSLL